ncbi:hypothetical protein [Anaerosporobacter sp.]
MYCRRCGKELNGKPNYCRYCGSQLTSENLENKNSFTSVNEQISETLQENDLKQEKKKLQRETMLFTAFSIFVIVVFILSIIIIQINPSLVQQDKSEKSNWSEELTDDTKQVGNIEEDNEYTNNAREEELKLGSAKVLEGDTILVSVFVDIKGDKWTEEEKKYCKDSLEEAVTWIEKQGEIYGKQIHFIYDMNPESDLLYYQSIDFAVESDTEDTNQYDYYRYNKLWIQENLDIKSINKKYGTNSVGYLFFLKDEGTSYTYSHYLEDKNYNKEEMCTIYLDDSSKYGVYENPATYAHEILHLFGALDLYDGACPEDVNEYVIDTYPYEIMLSTYHETLMPNENAEVKMISPITAYMLGWVDDINELYTFPEMEREEEACFSVNDFDGFYFENKESKE